MHESTQIKPHEFCWVELCTNDAEKAKQFYEALFCWASRTDYLPDGGSYTLMQVKNKEVAGIFQLTDELKSAGMKPNWSSYIQVENVDATTNKAENLGATVLKQPFDVMDVGRTATLADPTGAVFSLWQAKEDKGERLPHTQPGNIGWNELATTDIKQAGDFYSKLFGWTLETTNSNGKIYTCFMNGDQMVGGMMTFREEWKDKTPHWEIYFTVANLDLTISTAKEMGGELCYEPRDVPDVGRFTQVRDPQGIPFSLIQYPKK